MFSFMLFFQLAVRDQKIKDTENRIETEVSNIGAVASLKSSPDPDSCDEMSCSSPEARFSKVPKLFGRILGDIIFFVSSKRRCLKA